MNTTSTRTFVRPDIPDGEYNVSVCEIDAGTTADGRPRVRFQLEFLDPPARGLKDWKLSMLTKAGPAFFKEEMHRLGLDVNSAADFRAIEPELYTFTIRVAVANEDAGKRRIEILGKGEPRDDRHVGDASGITDLWSF